MTNYVILVVPANWTVDQTPGLSAEAAERWRAEVETGARVLIYKSAPVYAIEAEAEYMGVLEEAARWPANNVETLERDRADTAYFLPLKVLYVHDLLHHIPLSSIRAVVPEFSPRKQEWFSLDTQAYHDLVHWPG